MGTPISTTFHVPLEKGFRLLAFGLNLIIVYRAVTNSVTNMGLFYQNSGELNGVW